MQNIRYITEITLYAAQKPALLIFAAIFIGYAISRVKIRGFSLGITGVLIASTILGVAGFNIPDVVKMIGLMMFMYAVGVQSGPKILSIFSKSNIRHVKTAVAIFLIVTATAFVFAKIIGLSKDAFIGIYCGVLSSASALANILPLSNHPYAALGYSFSYPISMFLTIIFVNIIIKRYHLEQHPQLDVELEEKLRVKDEKIIEEPILVKDEEVIEGLSLPQAEDKYGVVITEVIHGDDIEFPQSDTKLHSGDIIITEGYESDVKSFEKIIGKPVEPESINIEEKIEARQILVTNKELDGKSIAEVEVRKKYKCVVTRIWRSGIFIAAPESWVKFEIGDTLIVVGDKEDLDRFTSYAGKQDKSSGDVDMLSMSLIIIIGMLVGDIAFHLPFGGTLKFGIAGAVLVLSLILGYFRRIGFVYGQMTPAARTVLRDLGLTFFIASVGMEAGNNLVNFDKPLLFRAFTACIAIWLGTLLLIFFLIMLYRGRKKAATVLSLFCGTITNTPAIGLVVENTGSEEFMIPFASVYAIATVAIIIASQILYAIY